MQLVSTSLLLINFNFQSELRKEIFIFAALLFQVITKRHTKAIIWLFTELCLTYLIQKLLFLLQQIGILRFGILSKRKLCYVSKWVRLQLMLFGVLSAVLFLLLYHQRSFIYLTWARIDTSQFMSIKHPKIDSLLQP